jgi:hypothetical protein
MPVSSDAPSAVALSSPRQTPTSRWLWVLAFLGSLGVHGAAFVSLALLARSPISTAPSPSATSIPIAIVDLPTAVDRPPAQPIETQTDVQAEPVSPPIVSAPAPMLSFEPDVSAPEISPEGVSEAASEQTETEIEIEIEIADPVEHEHPDSTAAPRSDSSSPQSSSPNPENTLPALPDTFPGDPPPTIETPPAPDLPSVTVTSQSDPVELTVSLTVQAIALSGDPPEPYPAQRDRQTFIHDPTGQLGGAIATCPVVPEIHRFAGIPVTFQMRRDTPSPMLSLVESSGTSSAYEAFAECIVQRWDFSTLTLPGAITDPLIISVTLEPRRP